VTTSTWSARSRHIHDRWGSCPGALEEAVEILRKFDAETDQKLPRTHIVFGDYKGEIAAKPGERVVFIGDCAQWHGTLGDQLIDVQNLYRDRSALDPHTVLGEDASAKQIKTRNLLKQSAGKPYMRLQGCPVSVSEQAQTLVAIGGFRDPARSGPGMKAYVVWRSKMLLKRLGGQKYQIAGPTTRGDAAPIIERGAAAE
jgi:hypothetical protein